MNNRPYGNELLDVARRTLLDEILPLLPPEKTYDALMVASAMSIASRELAPRVADDQAAQREIADCYSPPIRAGPAYPTGQALPDLNSRSALPSADTPRSQ